MSSLNQLEIISRGSVDILSPDFNSASDLASPTGTSQDVKVDRHISLEVLPPEQPRCSGHHDTADGLQLTSEEDASLHACLDSATKEIAHSQLQTENLLQRIEDLSGRIRSGLNLVESTGATVAALPLGRDAGNSSDVMMMSSSLEETHQEETEKQKESSQRETCAAEKGEEEGGEKEGGEKEGGVGGVASPQVDDRDPKLVKALEKMRRLDKKLADIVMREREVKERRRELELQIAGVDCHTPSSTENDATAVSPVFPTQLLEDDTEHEIATKTSLTANSTDFIQRNVEETGVVERLTEAGSHRLEQLLAQEEEHTETGRGTVMTQSNGFSFSAFDQGALRHIDIQLQALNGNVACESPNSRGVLDDHSSEAQTLTEIDDKLALLHSPLTEPHVLSPSVLHQLLEQCMKEQLP